MKQIKAPIFLEAVLAIEIIQFRRESQIKAPIFLEAVLAIEIIQLRRESQP